MSLAKLSDEDRTRTAHEACFLLNLAVRELTSPVQVFEFCQKRLNEMAIEFTTKRILPSMSELTGLRHIAFQSAVLAVFRLRETRDHLLVGWLFTERQLRDLGFMPVEEFIGGERNWRSLEIVRHQILGHSIARKATKAKPGRIISPSSLGKAMWQAGLSDWEAFADRVRKELIPGVQRVRDELAEMYPDARTYVKLFGMEYDFYSNWYSSEDPRS